MGNCDHIAEDHIHTDITCNIEEPLHKYRLETVSNELLGEAGGDLHMFYWTQTSTSDSAIIQPNQPITTNSTYQHKTFNIYFYLIVIFYNIKHKMKESG